MSLVLANDVEQSEATISRPFADDPLILVVVANPDLCDIRPIAYTERPKLVVDACGPHLLTLVHQLEVESGVRRVPPELGMGPVCSHSHIQR
jgi:hypothetical protein